MRCHLFVVAVLLAMGSLAAAAQQESTPAGNAQDSPASSDSGAKQNSDATQSRQAPSSSRPPDSSYTQTKPNPNLIAPRSDTVNADALQEGESSSKDDQIDLSPPADDLKAHPNNSDVLKDEGSTGSSGVNEMHPWDPHKAAKDIEVGDFYFKRKNYTAAADRYREALFYKDNDVIATFHLAECLEKMEQPAEAQKEYENYLKVLPNGPEAEKARKAIARLNASAAKPK